MTRCYRTTTAKLFGTWQLEHAESGGKVDDIPAAIGREIGINNSSMMVVQMAQT